MKFLKNESFCNQYLPCMNHPLKQLNQSTTNENMFPCYSICFFSPTECNTNNFLSSHYMKFSFHFIKSASIIIIFARSRIQPIEWDCGSILSQR